jgi:hypothetical protein
MRARRHHDQVPGRHVAGLAAHLGPGGALGEDQDLVVVGVHLGADVLAGLQGHHHHLGVLSGEPHGAEEVVLRGVLGDRHSEHETSWPGWRN